MKRALLFGGLAGAVLLIGQGEEARVFVDYQEVMIPMRDGVRLQTVLLTPEESQRSAALPDRPHAVRRAGQGRGGEGTSGGPALAERELHFRMRRTSAGRFQSEGKFVMFRPPHDPEGRQRRGRNHRRLGHRGMAGQERAEQQRTRGHRGHLLRRVDRGDGGVGSASGAEGGDRAGVAGRPVPGRRFPSQRRVPPELRLRVFGDAGDVRDGELPLSIRPRRTPTTGISGLGALSNADEKYFHGKVPTWTDFTRHPNYDAFWQRQAFAPVSERGEAADPARGGMVGPGGFLRTAEDLRTDGAARHPSSATISSRARGTTGAGTGTEASWAPSISAAIRRCIIARRFFSRGSITGCADEERQWKLAEATVFETGANEWKEHDSWPPKSGVEARRLYFREGRRLEFDKPAEAASMNM